MSVKVSAVFELSTVETPTTGVPAAASPSITHNQFKNTIALTATSTPAASDCSYTEPALVANVKTIDLTAIPGTYGRTVDGTGKKVRALEFVNPGSNPVVITQGASDPYLLFGTAGSLTVPAKGHIQMYYGDGAPTINSGAKTILLTGSGTDQFKLGLVFG